MGRPRTKRLELPKRPPAGAVLVRCLGPGAEHQFYSAHPPTERVCSYCRQVIAKMALGPIGLRGQKNPFPEED